ncbi:MAG: transposase [Planctomycetes bacterium]|nr:transposase [Planctomycetota bacterium]
MRLSRQEVRKSSVGIPEIRFEDQYLTSFSGLVILQALVNGMGLRARLQECVRHLSKSASYSASTFLLILVTHSFLGWRRLRDIDYYRGDPLLKRFLGLERIPDVSTLSRRLVQMDERVVEGLRTLKGTWSSTEYSIPVHPASPWTSTALSSAPRAVEHRHCSRLQQEEGAAQLLSAICDHRTDGRSSMCCIVLGTSTTPTGRWTSFGRVSRRSSREAFAADWRRGSTAPTSARRRARGCATRASSFQSACRLSASRAEVADPAASALAEHRRRVGLVRVRLEAAEVESRHAVPRLPTSGQDSPEGPDSAGPLRADRAT